MQFLQNGFNARLQLGVSYLEPGICIGYTTYTRSINSARQFTGVAEVVYPIFLYQIETENNNSNFYIFFHFVLILLFFIYIFFVVVVVSVFLYSTYNSIF